MSKSSSSARASGWDIDDELDIAQVFQATAHDKRDASEDTETPSEDERSWGKSLRATSNRKLSCYISRVASADSSKHLKALACSIGHLRLTLGGVETWAIVDSGSEFNIISKDLAEDLRGTHAVDPSGADWEVRGESYGEARTRNTVVGAKAYRNRIRNLMNTASTVADLLRYFTIGHQHPILTQTKSLPCGSYIYHSDASSRRHAGKQARAEGHEGSAAFAARVQRHGSLRTRKDPSPCRCRHSCTREWAVRGSIARSRSLRPGDYQGDHLS